MVYDKPHDSGSPSYPQSYASMGLSDHMLITLYLFIEKGSTYVITCLYG